MDLLALRAAVRDRAAINANDQLASDSVLTGFINSALRQIQVANPNGWDWLRSDHDWTTVAGLATYPFQAVNDIGIAGVDTDTTIVHKVVDVRWINDAGLPSQITITSAPDFRNRAIDGAQGTPYFCCITARTVILHPVPADTAAWACAGVTSPAYMQARVCRPLAEFGLRSGW